MSPEDTVDLLELVVQVCPAMRLEERTAEAWYLILGQYPMTDCIAAVRSVAARQTWIAPADIATAVREARRDRLERANLIYEPTDSETPIDACHRIAALRRQAADGTLPAAHPAHALAPADGAGPPEQVIAIVQRARDQRRERAQALAMPCPWCHAAEGVACEIPNPKGDKHRPLRLRIAHDARIQAATAQTSPKGAST